MYTCNLSIGLELILVVCNPALWLQLLPLVAIIIPRLLPPVKWWLERDYLVSFTIYHFVPSRCRSGPSHVVSSDVASLDILHVPFLRGAAFTEVSVLFNSYCLRIHFLHVHFV